MKYRKIPKISPGAYIFQRLFLRGLFLEGLIFGGAYGTEGNLRFKIDCAGLIVGSKFTVLPSVSEIVAQLCLENSMQTLLNFFGSTPQKIRMVCMELSEYNRLTSQRQFAPKCSFVASRPLGHCSFRIS